MSALVLPALGVAAGAGVLWMALAALLGRVGTEQAKYTVLREHKAQGFKFELRRYHPCVVASYVASGPDAMGAANQGFRPLAGFIFGGNTKGGAGCGAEKIAMTTPVTMAPAASERIAMTTPVTMAPASSSGGPPAPAPGPSSYVVSFVMPSKYTRVADLPAPHDAGVTLAEVPARYEVVSDHSSRAFPRGDEYAALSAKLRAAAEAAGYAVLAPAGAPARGYAYDPPFTPGFMKRNELAFEVAGPLPGDRDA